MHIRKVVGIAFVAMGLGTGSCYPYGDIMTHKEEAELEALSHDMVKNFVPGGVDSRSRYSSLCNVLRDITSRAEKLYGRASFTHFLSETLKFFDSRAIKLFSDPAKLSKKDLDSVLGEIKRWLDSGGFEVRRDEPSRQNKTRSVLGTVLKDLQQIGKKLVDVVTK